MAPMTSQFHTDAGGQSIENSHIEASPLSLLTNEAEQYVRRQHLNGDPITISPANQATVQHLTSNNNTPASAFNLSFVANQTDASSAFLLSSRDASGQLLLLFALLALINLIVILGNILVIVAVYANAKLRSVTNIFIVSLATADLLLGVLVLPYAMLYEVLDVWIFGQIWCRGWLVTDVWISTASILNLCAISIDRYVAVTRPVKYRSIMTARRAKCIVAIVWILSFIICFPPLLPNWSAPTFPSIGLMGTPSLADRPQSAPLIVSKTKPELGDNDDSMRMMASLPRRTKRQIEVARNESAHFDLGRRKLLENKDTRGNFGLTSSLPTRQPVSKQDTDGNEQKYVKSTEIELDYTGERRGLSPNNDGASGKNYHNNILGGSQIGKEAGNNWTECEFCCSKTMSLANNDNSSGGKDNKQSPNRGFIIIIEQGEELKFNDCGVLNLSLLLPPFGYICKQCKNARERTGPRTHLEIVAEFQRLPITNEYKPLEAPAQTAASSNRQTRRIDCNGCHENSMCPLVLLGNCKLAGAASTGSGGNAMESNSARARPISLVNGGDNAEAKTHRYIWGLLVPVNHDNVTRMSNSRANRRVVRARGLISLAYGKWAKPFKLVARPKSNSIVSAKYSTFRRRRPQIIQNASDNDHDSSGHRKERTVEANQSNNIASQPDDTSGPQQALGRDDLRANSSQSNMKPSTLFESENNNNNSDVDGAIGLNSIEANRKPKRSLRGDADCDDQSANELERSRWPTQPREMMKQRLAFNVSIHLRISIALLSGCNGKEHPESSNCVQFKMCLLSGDGDDDDDDGAAGHEVSVVLEKIKVFRGNNSNVSMDVSEQARNLRPVSNGSDPDFWMSASPRRSFNELDGFYANESNDKIFIGKQTSEYIRLNDFLAKPPTSAQQFFEITLLTRLRVAQGDTSCSGGTGPGCAKRAQVKLQKVSLKIDRTKEFVRFRCGPAELVHDYRAPAHDTQSALSIDCPLTLGNKINGDQSSSPSATGNSNAQDNLATRAETLLSGRYKTGGKEGVRMDESKASADFGRLLGRLHSIVNAQAGRESALSGRTESLGEQSLSSKFMPLVSSAIWSASGSNDGGGQLSRVANLVEASQQKRRHHREYLVARPAICADLAVQELDQRDGVGNSIDQRTPGLGSRLSQPNVVCLSGEVPTLRELNKDRPKVLFLVVRRAQVNNIRGVNSLTGASESGREDKLNNTMDGRKQLSEAKQDKQRPEARVVGTKATRRTRRRRSSPNGSSSARRASGTADKHDDVLAQIIEQSGGSSQYPGDGVEFGKELNGKHRYEASPKTCTLFHEKTYVIYSALGSFYIPMLIMVFFYSRIYLVASRAQKAMQRGYMTTKSWPSNSGYQNGANNFNSNCKSSFRAGLSQGNHCDGSYPCEMSPKGLKSRGPERVTLRIHRRTDQHQQSKVGSPQHHNDAPSGAQSTLLTTARRSNTDIGSCNEQSVSDVNSSSIRTPLGCKSILLQLTAIEQRQASVNARNRRARFSFDDTAAPTFSAKTRSVADIRIPGSISSSAGADVNSGSSNLKLPGRAIDLHMQLKSDEHGLCEKVDQSPGGTRLDQPGQCGDDKHEIDIRIRMNPKDEDTLLDETANVESYNDGSISNSNHEPLRHTKEFADDNRVHCTHDKQHKQSHKKGKRHHDHGRNHHHRRHNHHHHHHHHRHHHHNHHHQHGYHHQGEHIKMQRHHDDNHRHCRHHCYHHRYHSRHQDLDRKQEKEDLANSAHQAQEGTSEPLKKELITTYSADSDKFRTTLIRDDDEFVQITISKCNSSDGGEQQQCDANICDEGTNLLDIRTGNQDEQLETKTSSAKVTDDVRAPAIVISCESRSRLSETRAVLANHHDEKSLRQANCVDSAGQKSLYSCDAQASSSAAAEPNQSGGGLGLMANQMRKQSMMLLTSLTTRSSQTLRRLSMAAAYPVDALLRVRSRSRQSDFDRDDDDEIGHDRSDAGTTSSADSVNDSKGQAEQTGDINNVHGLQRTSARKTGRDARKKPSKELRKRKVKSKKKKGSVSPLTGQKKTFDDYLMAVAGIDTSSDESSREYYPDDFGDTMSDNEDDDDNDNNGPTGLASSSDESVNLSRMLTIENLLIPKIAITSSYGLKGSSDQERQRDIEKADSHSMDATAPRTERSMSMGAERDINSSIRSDDQREAEMNLHAQSDEMRRNELDKLGPEKQLRATAGHNNDESARLILANEMQGVRICGTNSGSSSNTIAATTLRFPREAKLSSTSDNRPRPSAVGLHRQGALYESATSRASIKLSSANGSQLAAATTAGPTTLASVAVAKLVDLASGHMTNHQLIKSNNCILSPIVTSTLLDQKPVATGTSPVGPAAPAAARRRGAKRTSRWHAKRLRAETKAAKTVAIIVGGFIFCWLPFFTAYLTRAIVCNTPQCIPQSLLSLFIWLGYLNSAINPVIYGLFSADFRHAFKNIVCRCRLRNNHEDTATVSVLVGSIIKSIM